MRKILLAAVGVAAYCHPVLAQNRAVSGRVTDENGQPIPSVSVQVKGTNQGTVTDKDGRYTINVPSNATTLVFSAAEQGSSERKIGSSNTVNIQLAAKDRGLDEVVVVGYQVRKKREEGGAVSQIKGREIQNTPNVSVDRALQGRAAGVLVQANNGIPGGGINVRVRGTASFSTSAQPLYIVDGVQINNSGQSSFTQSNALAFLNPNDIETIDVLKDAASAAIYGAQAANGVVIITTKKGRSGKTRFTFNAYTGYSERLKKLDNLSTTDWVQARAEADFNRYSVLAPAGGYTFLDSRRYALTELRNATGWANALVNSWNDKQIDSAIATLPNNDWQDLSMRRGKIQNYDLGMTGGNDKTTFALSANYTYQSTIFNKVDFKRYGLSANVQNKVNDKVTVGLKLNLSTFDQQVPFATDGSSLGNPAFSSATILNVNKLYNADGTYFGLPGNNQALAGALNQNIIAVNEYNSGNQRTNQLVGAVTLDYKPVSWLTYRAFASLDYRLVQGAQYRDPRTNDGFAVRGRATTESNWVTNFLTTHTLSAERAFGKLKVDGLVGYEYRRDLNEQTFARAIGFPSPYFTTLDAGATPEAVGQSWTGFKRSSGFARANLGYDQRFILSLIARRDGSSRFGVNNKLGNFYGVIGTWAVDRERFMKRLDWISQLRLRASWGQTGNDQIGNFTSRRLYGAGVQYNGAAGLQYSSLGNDNLTWETNQTTNLGLDFGFFRNRITGSVEAYDRTTKAALLAPQLSWMTGIGSYNDNLGEVNIKGVEVTLNGDVLRPKNPNGLRYNVGFTFSYAYNKVTKLYNDLQVLPGDPSTRVGRSLNSVFTQVYEGVNPATGRPMFRDTFGNLTYNPIARDRRYIGDQEPDYWGGMTHTISYKGFTVDALFSYEYGRLATDGQINFMIENANRLINGAKFAYDGRWTTPGQITSYPRIYDAGTEPGGVNHAIGSSRLWRKADYIRLRDLRISYDLQQSLVRRLKLTNVRLYVQGQNLWTMSDWWGYDPEFVSTSTGIIPQTRNYNIGIQVGF